VLETSEGILAGIIRETEAYMGVTDRASHAYGGKITERNRSMYLQGGFAYVYRIYGLYHCFNITASTTGNPEAVLIRSIVPIAGMDKMVQNRQKNGRGKKYPAADAMDAKARLAMTDGPGRLCTAMGICREMDGWDLLASPLYLADRGISVENVQTAPRVGIDYAGEDKDKPWRYIASLSPQI